MKDSEEWDYGPFKVGDVVEGFGFRFDTYCNGMQAVVVGGLKQRLGINWAVGDCDAPAYRVKWQDGQESQVEACNIRRRKPPMTGLEDVLALFKVQPRVKEAV